MTLPDKTQRDSWDGARVRKRVNLGNERFTRSLQTTYAGKAGTMDG